MTTKDNVLLNYIRHPHLEERRPINTTQGKVPTPDIRSAAVRAGYKTWNHEPGSRDSTAASGIKIKNPPVPLYNIFSKIFDPYPPYFHTN